MDTILDIQIGIAKLDLLCLWLCERLRKQGIEPTEKKLLRLVDGMNKNGLKEEFDNYLESLYG